MAREFDAMIILDAVAYPPTILGVPQGMVLGNFVAAIVILAGIIFTAWIANVPIGTWPLVGVGVASILVHSWLWRRAVKDPFLQQKWLLRVSAPETRYRRYGASRRLGRTRNNNPFSRRGRFYYP